MSYESTENTEAEVIDAEGEEQAQPRTNQLARRGFSEVSLSTDNAATAALVAKSRADIESRWIMAMKRPREIDQVRQLMIKECKRPGFANVAIYHVPRGNKDISGLSIRFAEVAMRCMGNMAVEAMVLYDSELERVVRVSATDFESNSTWHRDITIRKTVERKQLKRGQRPIAERVNSYGDRVWIVEGTDDEIGVKEAAQISKAARTAILRLIPGHLQDEMFNICHSIQKDKAAKNPDAEMNAVFDAFAGLNIMPAQLEQWLGCPVKMATPAQIVSLRGLYRAINDGELTWMEALERAQDGRPKPGPAVAPSSSPPAASATPASATPPTTQSQPAQTQAKGAARSRGTAAVKDQIRQPASSPPQAQAHPNAPEPKTTQEPAPDIKPAPRLSEQRSERPVIDMEERPCSMCGVPLDVPKDTPPGAQRCEACASE